MVVQLAPNLESLLADGRGVLGERPHASRADSHQGTISRDVETVDGAPGRNAGDVLRDVGARFLRVADVDECVLGDDHAVRPRHTHTVWGRDGGRQRVHAVLDPHALEPAPEEAVLRREVWRRDGNGVSLHSERSRAHVGRRRDVREQRGEVVVVDANGPRREDDIVPRLAGLRHAHALARDGCGSEVLGLSETWPNAEFAAPHHHVAVLPRRRFWFQYPVHGISRYAIHDPARTVTSTASAVSDAKVIWKLPDGAPPVIRYASMSTR